MCATATASFTFESHVILPVDQLLRVDDLHVSFVGE